MIKLWRLFVLMLGGLTISNAAFAEADLEYGEYLSSECTGCHLLSGKESNIPTIINWDAQSFVAVLQAYKNKELENKVMQNIATRLGQDEIESLAAFFATIKPKGGAD